MVHSLGAGTSLISCKRGKEMITEIGEMSRGWHLNSIRLETRYNDCLHRWRQETQKSWLASLIHVSRWGTDLTKKTKGHVKSSFPRHGFLYFRKYSYHAFWGFSYSLFYFFCKCKTSFELQKPKSNGSFSPRHTLHLKSPKCFVHIPALVSVQLTWLGTIEPGLL